MIMVIQRVGAFYAKNFPKRLQNQSYRVRRALLSGAFAFRYGSENGGRVYVIEKGLSLLFFCRFYGHSFKFFI